MQRKLTPQQIEKQLGMQYARMLQESNQGHYASASRDCEDISRWLDMLNHYNKIAMNMQTKKVAGAFV